MATRLQTRALLGCCCEVLYALTFFAPRWDMGQAVMCKDSENVQADARVLCRLGLTRRVHVN